MNFISKTIRMALILNILLAFQTIPALAANSAPSVAPTGRTEETNSTDMMRAYLQLQEQVHATQLAIERNRQQAEEMAGKSQQAMDGRLKAIEESLAAQRNGELQAVQSSNHLMLLLAGMFAAIALLAMFVMAVFQWRTVNRLAEISASAAAGGFAFGAGRPLAALGAGESHSVTISTPDSSGAQPSSAGLLNAVERLEKRINELEHTAHPPLEEPKPEQANPSGSEAGAETRKEPFSDEPKHNHPGNGAGPETLASSVSANGPSESEAEHGSVKESEPTTDEGRITGLLGKGQSLLNVDKAEEALACFDEVLTLDARNAEALVKKGTALERLRKLEEAIECYNRAIAADNSMTIAYLHKGGLFNRLERFTEAMQCYEQALRTQEKSA